MKQMYQNILYLAAAFIIGCSSGQIDNNHAETYRYRIWRNNAGDCYHVLNLDTGKKGNICGASGIDMTFTPDDFGTFKGGLFGDYLKKEIGNPGLDEIVITIKTLPKKD